MALAFLKALHLVNILSGIRLVLIVHRCFHPFLQRYSWLSPRLSRLAYLKNMHRAYHKWPEDGREQKGKELSRCMSCKLSCLISVTVEDEIKSGEQ
jgi:hypothetical protein